MKHLKKLLLLLGLIMMSAPCTAYIYNYERDTVIMNGVYYETNFLVDNYYLSGSSNYYNASIIHLLTAGTSLSVPSEITIDNKAYKVRSVGKHTYLKGYPTRYFFNSTVSTTNGWRSEWKDDTGFHSGPNDALNTSVEYSAVPVYNSNSGLKNLTFQGGIEIYGPFTSNSLETLNFQGDATIKGDLYVVGLRNLNLNGALDISGTLTSNRLTEIHFNNLTCSGKFECSSLTDVYFPALKYEWVLFSGYVFTGVSFSGSQWEDHFPSSLKKQIRAHVWDLTANQLAELQNSAIWCDFKEIVNHKSNVNYAITSDGNATINFVEIKGNASYVSATGTSQLASASSGSKSGTVKAGGNYAVEIRDVDFDTKKVSLLRNGHVATLESYEDQGQPLRYHEDLDLQQNVSYEVSVSDKTCTLTFNQTGYTGRIMYQKTLNGTTSTGVVTGMSPTVTCAQGSQLKLTIPYDPTSYTPNKLYLGGSEVTMTKTNGEATVTITVPTSASAQIDLTWQAPQQTYETHQPQIMIMRSGEGQVVFKGAICLPSDEWSQYLDDYEQSGLLLSGRDGYETWVMTGNGPVSCTQTVTNVTAPDVDPRGDDSLDEGSWGFIIEITPVAGQKLKTLLLGRITGDELSWEDMVSEGYSNGSYVTYDASTNTYTFDIRGDYMNFGVGDYVVNIAMGPEETAIETGKTLSFVRKGGRGQSWIYWNDQSQDFFFTEGSSSKIVPNEQLTDVQMHVQIEEGEVLHVYKNGQDITSQFQLRENTIEYCAELDKESATYTLLIDDAPDANPTWTIHNATEADVIVEQTLKDGTTTTATYAGNLNDLVIDDTQVSKVTLKVYAENANESKPVRVLVNGQDVSYQFSTYVDDGDGFRLCYDVPVSELTNCSWDISYNTDHAQTFVVKGGTSDPVLVEVEREFLEGDPNLSISRNDGPATIYLPPYDSEYNSYINMTVYVDTYEGITIKRNGIDVTYYFTETKQSNGQRYYTLNISEGDMEDNSTVGLLSFDIREAAVWEIVYKSIDEQETKFSIINHDQLALRAVRSYVTGGAPAIQPISQDHYEFSFNDADRENTSSYYLKVPIKDANYQYYPVRVLRNGVDVTFDDNFLDEFADDYLIYKVNMRVDETWDISRDTSHRQTFIVKGGTNGEDVEIEYSYPIDAYDTDVYPAMDGKPHHLDFPAYDSERAPGAIITIDVKEGNSFTVLRNGVNVKDKFSLVTGSAGASAGYTRYRLSEAANGGSDTQEALGFQFRDPAVWQITIGDTERFDVNRDGSISIADVTTLVNKILGKE